MSGHSKWANIKHRKGKQDAVKGKVFTKLIREITVAARHGGGDINGNSRLRIVVDKALSQNMPRDTIDRAIKRGVGSDEGGNMEAVRYEGYGPKGVAVIVDCLTDNRNRTVSEVRFAFTKHGGNLGTDGSVAYLFKERGLICCPPKSDETKILETALNEGADDVVTNDDGSIDVLTTTDNFLKVKTALENAKIAISNASVTWLADNLITLDKENGEKVLKLLEVLDELDDVQNVYSNADIPEEVLG
jgi:YebC/PmpR family DNA-binding regulatory protein